jgi:hypothetical protein
MADIGEVTHEIEIIPLEQPVEAPAPAQPVETPQEEPVPA